jgi:hypothetical protein
MKFSIAAPGVAALSASDFDDLYYFYVATVAHLVLVVALVWVWAASWRRWLGRATATPQS